MSDVNWDAVLNKQLPPGFIPNASIWNRIWNASLIYSTVDCSYNPANLSKAKQSNQSYFFQPKDDTTSTHMHCVFRDTHSLRNILLEEMEASPPVGLSRNPDCVQSRLCLLLRFTERRERKPVLVNLQSSAWINCVMLDRDREHVHIR